MGKSIKFLLVALVVCFGTSFAAKADQFTGTAGTGSVVFTGVDVYDVGTPTSLNPFGLTQGNPCVSNGQAPPCQTTLGGGFEVATITFFSNGSFIINPTTVSTGNGGTVGAWENGTAPSSSIFTVSGSTLGGLTAGTSETANPSSNAANCPHAVGTGWCIDGTSNGGAGGLTYLGTVNGINGVFTAVDNSVEVAFSLTSTATPEPSSLLMLGSGLLGLIGFGLRRKAIV